MNDAIDLLGSLDTKIAQFDTVIDTGTEVLEGMKAQRAALISLRDIVLTLELQDVSQRARVEEFERRTAE